MKKTCKLIEFIFFQSIVSCLFLFNIGCGLDTVYVIDAPSTIHEPYYQSISQDSHYFKFHTNEPSAADEDSLGYIFLGTDIYYKIYNDSSQLETETSNLKSYAQNEETSYNSFTRLKDTYNYIPLQINNNKIDFRIRNNNSSQAVEIRLATEGLLQSKILVNDNLISNSEISIPMRNINGKLKPFTFDKRNGGDTVPKADDSDVKFNSNIETSDWYVAMFAVSIGRDSNYTELTSPITYLGSVKIEVLN